MAKSKDLAKKRSKKYRSKITSKFVIQLQQCKLRSKRKNLPFNLTKEYLIEIYQQQKQKCAITGALFQLDAISNNPNSISLDRIIPEKGYIKGNVRFICNIVNKMKSNLTDTELSMWSKRVVAGFNSNQDKQILIPNFSTLADLIDRLIVEVNKLGFYENAKRQEHSKKNPDPLTIIKYDNLSRDCCEYRDMLKTAINNMMSDIITNNHYITLPSNRTFSKPPKSVGELIEELCHASTSNIKEELKKAFEYESTKRRK